MPVYEFEFEYSTYRYRTYREVLLFLTQQVQNVEDINNFIASVKTKQGETYYIYCVYDSDTYKPRDVLMKCFHIPGASFITEEGDKNELYRTICPMDSRLPSTAGPCNKKPIHCINSQSKTSLYPQNPLSSIQNM